LDISLSKFLEYFLEIFRGLSTGQVFPIQILLWCIKDFYHKFRANLLLLRKNSKAGKSRVLTKNLRKGTFVLEKSL
jgi:hypothetical protein